jgi:hypothetical protein
MRNLGASCPHNCYVYAMHVAAAGATCSFAPNPDCTRVRQAL